jgi:hypothetical protein
MAKTSWARHSFGTFAIALPITVLLVAAWSAGEGVGYLRECNGRPTEVTKVLSRPFQAIE